MASKDTNIDFLNQKLDTIAISILNGLNNIINERQYLEDNLKEGYINLAKSRYIMRGQNISILQVNTSTLKSSLKSFSSESDVEGVKFRSFSHENDIPFKERALKHRSTANGENEEDLCEDLKNTLTVDSPDDENKEKEHSTLSDDPLKWFGVLVPDTLKTSQKRFQQATITAMKIASFQNELKALCSQYKEYRLQKKQLNQNLPKQ